MITAKAIMTENVVTVDEDMTLKEAAKFMLNKNVNSLIVSKQNLPIAMISANDIIKGSLNKNISKILVKNVMNKNFMIIGPETNYYFIVKRLKEEGIKKFPVVFKNKIVGVITETDIVNATRDFTRWHQILQEIVLAIFGLFTAFFLFFLSPFGKLIFGR